MLEEVATFIASYEAAQETHRKTPPKELGEPHNPETCKFCVFDATVGSAFAALAESADPLVRWIAQNCKGYGQEAIEVLRLLPASMETLDALAREKGWCGDWEQLCAEARADGVLPAPAEPEATS